eukprot:TRINITY_DN901_c3_g3_i3.p1 TRINITY_DN901_c3_g3~~TRINITY_DN901_c3_g3_i3.p1  ORF type:complete len:3518 (+),score=966.74 TRINITY_DN901_c3_g3_i3:810-11363(+)
MLKGGAETATMVRDEWVAAMGSLIRLSSTSGKDACLLADPTQQNDSRVVHVAMDIASALLAERYDTNMATSSSLLTASSLLEAVLNCIVSCLTFNKVLVSSFEKRMGYTTVSTMLKRFGEGFDGQPHTYITYEQLKASCHVPLILLAVSGAPMLTPAAVEEFVLMGSTVLEGLDGDRKDKGDPWKKLWGTPSAEWSDSEDGEGSCTDSFVFRTVSQISREEGGMTASFSSSSSQFSPANDGSPISFTVPTNYVSLEAASLPWCNGHAFGLLLYEFAGCNTDFRLRKLLLHTLLYALVRFPRQYLKQTDSDACLWYYYPISVISSYYHIDLDTCMQEAFLSCSLGLITYALKRVGDPQRLSVWTHNVLDDALIFDLKCIIQLLHPPENSGVTDAQTGCGKWFLESTERVLAMVSKLHESGAHGVHKALRRAGLCEAVAKLIKSGFGWNDAPFIANVISILYRQCKRDRQSIRLLLDSCHEFLADLYALMIYLIPTEEPTTYSHFRVVTQLLYLISCEHDVVGDLITVSEIAPIGHSLHDTIRYFKTIECPHCLPRPSYSFPEAPASAEPTPELPTLNVSRSTCHHRQHPHIPVRDAPKVVIVPDDPLKKAALRRKIMLTLIKLFERTKSGAADFRACRGFHRIGDACKRDASVAGSLVTGTATAYYDVQDPNAGPLEAIAAQTTAFEQSESELADNPHGVDLLWYLQGNLLTYLAVATAACMSAPGTAAMDESRLSVSLGESLVSVCPASLPGSKLLLAMALIRLAVHSTTLPTPDDVVSQTLLHHGKIPTSIVVPQLAVDKHHMWTVYHPSALISALVLTRHGNEEGWEASSLLQRHVLSIIRKVNSVSVHNAVELQISGLVRRLLGWVDELKERKDHDLCKAVFGVVREVGKTQCTVEEARKILQLVNDDYLGTYCVETLQYWAASDTPSEIGPHRYMSFANLKDDRVDSQAPVAILPRLQCSPWPHPNRGYTMSLWTRFEALDNAMGGAVIVSMFSHDDSGCCMVTDVCLNNTNASVSAALMFRVSMSDDTEDGSQITYYNTTPTGVSQLKPGKWYHLTITHYIELRTEGVNHTFAVKVDGGMRDGYHGRAQCLIPHDKKEKIKKFSRRGGKLSCMVFGASLNDYIFGKHNPEMSSSQKIMALLKAEDLDELIGSASSPFGSFQVGSVNLFWGSLTDWQVYLLYSICRDYCGDFLEALTNYHCHGILNAKVCGSPSSHIRGLASQWLTAAIGMLEGIEPSRNEGLQEKFLMTICVRKHAFVASRIVFIPRDKAVKVNREPQTPSVPTPSQPSLPTPNASPREGSTDQGREASDEEATDLVTETSELRKPSKINLANVPVVLASVDTKISMFNPVPLTLANGAVAMTNNTMKSNLRALGGMPTAISLVSLARNQATRVASLQMLSDLMKWSPENSQSMSFEGYAVLSWYLKKNRVVIDRDILAGCFMLAGVDVDNLEESFLQDKVAVKTIILDWGIWCRGPIEVQKLLLETLAKLVADHALSKAHRTMLIHAGAYQWLLRLTLTDTAVPDHRTISPVLRKEVVDLLSALSGISWGVAAPCHASLNLLLKHFIATANESDNTWRKALLSLWVVFLCRCTEKEMSSLIVEHNIDIFITLLGETCCESRLLFLLGLSTMIKHPAPRTAFAAISPDTLFYQYHLQRRPSTLLDATEPSVPEIQLLLLLLVRGVANTKKSSKVAVKQPLLALLFLKSYGTFITSGLNEQEAKILTRTANEVLATCTGSPSETASLHSDPIERLTAEEPAEQRSLKEIAAQLQKLITDGSLPSQIMSNENTPSSDRTKFTDLAYPQLLGSLPLMIEYTLRPAAEMSPLMTAHFKFKRCMITDALRQIFICGSNAVKQKYIDKNVHLHAAAMLHPRLTVGDKGFAWLALSLMCEVVSWGVAESLDTTDGAPPYPDMLETTLDFLSALSSPQAEVANDKGTAMQWIHHLQQHLLHAVLLKFRKRLFGAQTQKNGSVVRFVTYAETCLDTMHAWRFVNTSDIVHTPKSPTTSPTTAEVDVFLPLSELLDEDEEEEEEEARDHLKLLVEAATEPSQRHLYLLYPVKDSHRTRSRPVIDAEPQANTDVEIVWLLPEPVPSHNYRLNAYDWMLKDLSFACESPVRNTRARSTVVHPSDEPSSPATPATPVTPLESDEPPREIDGDLPDFQGAPEDVRSFVFWLFETIHVAVGCAVAMQNNKTNFALRSKLPRFGSTTADIALIKQMKRLLIELVSSFTLKLHHPLHPPPDAASTFALLTLLHSVSLNTTEVEPPEDIWCSQWWIPVSHSISQHSLIAMFTAKGDDDPTFTQQLMFHTSPRLRSAVGMERFQLRRVWKYLVEVKLSTVKKACIASALPADIKRQQTGDVATSCVLFSLFMSATPSPNAAWKTVPASGAEDRLFTPAFVAKIAKYHDKVSARAIKRHEDRKVIITGRMAAIKAQAATKAKVEKNLKTFPQKKLDAQGQTMKGISAMRSQMKDARGVVGKLVRSRVLLHPLWGDAAAVYTKMKQDGVINWRLDDVEGPDRMRVRLKRTLAVPLVEELKLVGDEPVVEEGSPLGTPREGDESDDDDDELKALIDHQFEPGMFGLDQDLYKGGTLKTAGHNSHQCAQVTPMAKVEGELVLFPNGLYYVSNDSPYRDDLERAAADIEPPPPGSRGVDEVAMRKHRKQKLIHRMHLYAVRHRVTAWYSEVSGVFRRRYLLMNNSLEIFTERGLAFFFSFQSEAARDRVYNLLLAQCPRAKEMSLSAENLKRWRDRWVQGKISNFQYLMSLNTLAGRSFNDVTQYPVFPYVLADYTSETLDLNDPASYRDLTRPMGCQTEERRIKAAHKYAETLEMYESMKVDTPKVKQGGLLRLPGWGSKSSKEANEAGDMDLYALPPYHHGSHFSNRATVLYYCIRLQPFTDYFCELNDLKLDVPDRCFHSINHAWKLSSAVSTTDVKELTPEFYYLPDFLVNNNRIRLGSKQDHVNVNHVELPPWAKGNPREFVMMQRRALEGEHCSKHLHHWIDLTFGFKAGRGEAAVDALNCFHPYAYEGAVNIDSISDDMLRQSTIDIINNFGQMPQQLLTKPHPKRMVERIFGMRDTSWWQVGRPLKKVYEAEFEKLGDGALVVAKTEVRKGFIKSLRVEGAARDSATTRGIDSVAEEDADDEVYSVPQNRLLLVHSSFEVGGEGDMIGMDKAPAEFLRYMTWDNSLRIHLYDDGRQGKEVLVLRQSCRADPVMTAATSVSDAAHIALGTDSGVVEIYRYGLTAPTAKPKPAPTEDWTVNHDHSPTGFKFTPDRSTPTAEYTPIPGCTLQVQGSEGKQRLLRPLASLHGHTQGVVSLVLSKEYNVILSGGRDGLLIVWDLLELTFVRSMTPITTDPVLGCDTWKTEVVKECPKRWVTITNIEINPQNGDIVAISMERTSPSGPGLSRGITQLNLWNINGVPIARKVLDDQPTCLQFTGHILAVGCSSGRILLFSAIDLSPISQPLNPRPDSTVVAMAVNEAHTKLYTAHQSSGSAAQNQSVLLTWMVAK